MGTRPVSIEVTASISGLQARMKAASSSVKSFAADAHTSIQRNRADWDGLAGGVGKVGLVALAGAAMAAKGFSAFDKSMSKVKATGADAAGAISELREAAIKAGADTQFSASEAADAITDLAKAGVSARDILGGGLSGALSLAAAGELEVKEAAEVTATALAQFKLEGTKASHVADLLAAGAGKAMGDVTDLGMALRQGGLVAAQTGLSIEETTAALSAFAQQGLLGSDAGTSLKTMLQRLTPQSAEAQKQFDALGISAYDSQGQFVGLANFAGQLRDQMSSLTPQARNAAMGVMFGTDAVRAANVLYSEGADGIQAWIKTVDDAGFAARQAATLTDNLAGDIERLMGSAETAAISGGRGLNDWLRGLVQGADGAVDALGKVPEPVLSATTRLTALAGVAGIATAATLKGVTAFSDYRASIARISADSPRMGRALTGATKAAKGLGIALAAIQVGAIFGEMAQGGVDKNLATIEQMANSLASISKGGGLASLDGQFRKLGDSWTMWGTAEAGITGVGDALHLAEKNSEGLMGAWNGFKQGVLGLVGLKTAATQLDGEIVKLDRSLSTLDGEQAAAGFRAAFEDAQAAAAAVGETFTADAALKAFPEYQAKLSEIARQYGVTIDSAEEWVSWMAGEVPAAVQEAAGANGDLVNSFGVVEGGAEGARLSVDDFLDSLFQLERGALSVSDAQIRMEQSFDDAKGRIKDWTAELEAKYRAEGKSEKQAKARAKAEVDAAIASGKALDINTDAGRANRSALNEIADASQVAVEAMIRNNEANADVEATAARARKQFIKQAEAMGLEADEAAALADEMGLIPKEIIAKIETELDREGINDWNAWDPKSKTAWIVTRTRQEGRNLPKNAAGGGAIVGAGTATSDSIPAMLSNGEHVLTADDVHDMGGQAAVYRLRALAQAGRLRFAAGGAVSLEDQLERLRIQQQIRDLTADLAEKESYKVGKKKRQRYKLRDIDRDEAKLQLALAEQELKAFDSRAWADGVDKLADLARGRASDLQSIASSVRSSLGGFDLRAALGGAWTQGHDASGNTWYTGSQTSAASMTSGARVKAAKVKAFAGKLDELRRAGLSAAVLEDIASLGVDEGSRVADSYLADPGQIASMNDAYAEIEAWSQAAGQYVTEASYQGGLAAAEAMATALEAQGASIGAAVAQGFATSLGYKLTAAGSLTKRALGGKVSAGEMYQVNELGVEAFVPAVNGFILTSGQVQQTQGGGRGVEIRVTTINPVAEPVSVTTNKALQYAAALGV